MCKMFFAVSYPLNVARHLSATVKAIVGKRINTCTPYLVSNKYATFKDRDSWAVLTDNGSTVVCWHPEVFPAYEHTKPLPEHKPEFKEEDSVLKVQYRRDAKSFFCSDGPNREELQALTYTTKHRWFPKKHKNRCPVPNPPFDRDGV